MILLGAVTGDIIGSAYEWVRVKTTDFELFNERTKFTDDTVLTMAVADKLLTPGSNYTEKLREYGHRYPNAGYGGSFREWLCSARPRPYNSFGNGSAMRVSPVAWAFNTLEEVLEEARHSALVTHNHPEGIRGAQAVAAAIFLALNHHDKEEIRGYITRAFGYPLDRSMEEIRPGYGFDETCQGSVPEAITAFLESSDFESAIRNAVSLGGDSDTLACISGAMAEAYYREIPSEIISNILNILPIDLVKILKTFSDKYEIPPHK